MNKDERIESLENALREMLRQFWDNGAYSEDDEAVLTYADKVLKGESQ